MMNTICRTVVTVVGIVVGGIVITKMVEAKTPIEAKYKDMSFKMN